MKRNLAVLLCAAVLMLPLSGCANTAGKDEAPAVGENGFEKITIRYGNPYNESTTQGQALNLAKELIEEGSGGNIQVDIFHGGTLGSEKDHIQAQKDGSIELLFSGTAGIGLYVPAISVLESFFAFDSNEELSASLDVLWDDVDAACQKEGFKLLGVFFDASPRQILSNKEIRSVKDIKDLKMRAPNSPIYINCTTELGAQAITMPLGDVYTSLQTGAVEAMEGTLDIITNQKFFEQGKYLIESAHVYTALYITYNLDAWNKLSENARQLITKAIAQSQEYQNELSVTNYETARQKLVEAGIEFVQLTDREAWRTAVRPAAKAYAESQGDLGVKIFENIPRMQ